MERMGSGKNNNLRKAIMYDHLLYRMEDNIVFNKYWSGIDDDTDLTSPFLMEKLNMTERYPVLYDFQTENFIRKHYHVNLLWKGS